MSPRSLFSISQHIKEAVGIVEPDRRIGEVGFLADDDFELAVGNLLGDYDVAGPISSTGQGAGESKMIGQESPTGLPNRQKTLTRGLAPCEAADLQQ